MSAYKNIYSTCFLLDIGHFYHLSDCCAGNPSHSRSLHFSSRTLIFDVKNMFSSLIFIKDTCRVGAGGVDASVETKHKHFIYVKRTAKVDWIYYYITYKMSYEIKMS